MTAGTSSGAGKTTVSLGLMGVLSKRCRVIPFEVGPYYIVAGYNEVNAYLKLVRKNLDKPTIASSKVASLLGRVGKCAKYMMTGGVAKNNEVVYEIENKIQEKIIIPFEPQIVGALGAALIAAGENN